MDWGAAAGPAVDARWSAAAVARFAFRHGATLPSESEKRLAVARESAEFLGHLADELVAEGVELTNAAPCAQCQRDYQAACPQGWRSDIAPGACAAPASYEGPCAPLGYFSAASAEGRAEIETRCLACWPCRGDRGSQAQ